MENPDPELVKPVDPQAERVHLVVNRYLKALMSGDIKAINEAYEAWIKISPP